jgi:hypothetical protein
MICKIRKNDEKSLDKQSPSDFDFGLRIAGSFIAREGQSEVGYGSPVMRMVAWTFFCPSPPWLAMSDGLVGVGYGGPAVRSFASTGVFFAC